MAASGGSKVTYGAKYAVATAAAVMMMMVVVVVVMMILEIMMTLRIPHSN